MMNSLQKKYPPYEGNEPYLYYAFAESDRGRAEKILRILLGRGCRVWYCCGRPGGSQELLRRQERAAGAALTVLFLTDSACADSDTKSYVLVNQDAGRQIICLDPDGEDRRLKMGLHESVPHISLYRLHNSEDIDSAIIHAEGFSQDIIGEPVKAGRSIAAKLSVLFCSLAVILAIVSVAGFLRGSRPSEEADEVSFSDPGIYAAVKDAAGGDVITEEFVAQLTVLKLDGMPESWDELSLMPDLERISIPQQVLLEGGVLPEGDYIIELNGGMS